MTDGTITFDGTNQTAVATTLGLYVMSHPTQPAILLYTSQAANDPAATAAAGQTITITGTTIKVTGTPTNPAAPPGSGSVNGGPVFLTPSQADGSYVTVVQHGATAGTDRPANAVRVFWRGSVAPTNATQFDRWVDTSGSTLTEKINTASSGQTWQVLGGASGSSEPSVLPSYAPTSGLTRRFTPLHSAYGVTAGLLAQFRSGLAKAKAGTGFCHIVAIGDSLTSGYMGSNAPVVNDFDNAYIQVLAKRLLADGVPSGGTGYIRGTQAMAATDSRLAFVNGSANGGSGSWTTNAQPWASHNGAGGTVTLTLAGGVGTRVDIQAPNNSAKFTYQVLDSTGAVIVASTAWDGDGTATIRAKSITGLTDAAKLVITTVAGTNLFFSLAILRASGLIVSNQAFFGSTASGGSGWQSNTNWYGARQTAAALAVPADLLLCGLGTNDKASNVTDANVGAALTTILADWPNASRLLLGMWEAGGFASGNNWKNYVASLYTLADTLNASAPTGLVDLVDRTRGFTAMNGRGYYGTDQTHPFRAAHEDAGRNLAALLAA